MRKSLIIERLIKKIKNKLISERKSDQLSLYISRFIINQFKKKEDFQLEDLEFERGDEYALFNLYCYFIEDENLNEPFSIRAEADMETMEIEITFNPSYFPDVMQDLVGEVKETVEHELEHIEQQNFEDVELADKSTGEDFVEYLTSDKEVPAFVRGLIKRAKTKKISLNKAMNEWFNENFRQFNDPSTEWSMVKDVWMEYATEMREKEKIKKFN
jgi:hypothetical protein